MRAHLISASFAVCCISCYDVMGPRGTQPIKREREKRKETGGRQKNEEGSSRIGAVALYIQQRESALHCECTS